MSWQVSFGNRDTLISVFVFLYCATRGNFSRLFFVLSFDISLAHVHLYLFCTPSFCFFNLYSLEAGWIEPVVGPVTFGRLGYFLACTGCQIWLHNLGNLSWKLAHLSAFGAAASDNTNKVGRHTWFGFSLFSKTCQIWARGEVRASPRDALAQMMWCGGSIVIQVFSNFECKLKIHSCTYICYFEEITSKIGIRTAELWGLIPRLFHQEIVGLDVKVCCLLLWCTL